jgi:hypothetical protein
MSDHSIYCPQCMRQTPHVKARAGMIMCMVCRHERLWNTTGWLGVPTSGPPFSKPPFSKEHPG